MNNVKRIMGYLSLPIVLTIVTCILFINAAALPKSLTMALPYISFIIFIIGMVLGIRFNKGKVFFLCLILGISQLLLSDSSFPSSIKAKSLSDAFDIISILLPINILFFSVFKERGIFTLWGQAKFGILIIQALLVVILLDPPNQDLRLFISHKLIDFEFINKIIVPQISLVLFGIAFIYFIIRLYFKPALLDSSLLGVVILTFSGVLLKNSYLGLYLFFTAAGLTLVISLLEISYTMAYRDELTKLPSRRALEEAMLKLGGKYAIAMVDIDYFKKFNDTYGHDIGDKVLQMVASNLKNISKVGKAYRYGGEEFTILFPNKTIADILPELEELRKDISKQKHTYKRKSKGKSTSKKLGVTISIGAAEKNEKFNNAEEVIQAADKALYRAKKSGRNCVSK